MASFVKFQPFFAYSIGFDEEAHAIFPLNPKNFCRKSAPLLLIGTNRGRCLLFSLDMLKQLTVLHEDADKRQIVAIGHWPFDGGRNGGYTAQYYRNGEHSPEISQDQEPCCSSSSDLVWLHYRCSAVALFKLLPEPESDEMFRFRPLRELNTGYYGFCHVVGDPIKKRMFVPDQEEATSVIRIRHRNGGEKLLVLGEEFMCQSLKRRRPEEQCPEGMFKGLVMGLELFTDSRGRDHLLLAFEDSTVCAFDLRTKEVLDALKHPKHPEMLCWSVASPSDGTALIAMSVIGQVYLLSYTPNEEGKELLKAECKIKKRQSGSPCTAISLLHFPAPSSDELRLAIGFKNGIIELHSVHPGPWTTKPLAKCANFHTGAIRTLTWSEFPDPNNTDRSQNRSILCSGSADGKVAIFILPHDLSNSL